MKHKKLIIVLVIVALLISAGGVFLYRTQQKQNRAYVQPVEYLNNSWVLNWNTESGRIVDGATQNVQVSFSNAIEEVYVHEGDAVAKGQKLLSLDTEVLSLSLDEAKLNLEKAKQTYQAEQAKLDKYKNLDSMSEAEKVQFAKDLENYLKKQQDDYNSAMEKAEAAAKATFDKQAKADADKANAEGRQAYNEKRDSDYQTALAAAKAKAAEDEKTDENSTEDDTTGGSTDDSGNGSGSSEKKDTFDEANFKAGFDASYPAYVEIQPEEFDAEAWEAQYMADNPYEEDTPDDLNPWDPNYYSDAEKSEMISAQEVTVKYAASSVKSAELSVQEAENQLNDATITATMDGVVVTMQDKDNLLNDGSPFMTISSASGVAVRGAISEFDLGNKKVGDKISVYSYMTGATSEAEIVDISQYPAESGEFYASGNQNASMYPYTAILDSATGFSSGDYVDISRVLDEEAEGIFLMKLYVRGDSEGSYVMMDDGTGHLMKQRVTTGYTVDDYVEITSGLTTTDMIAFPYGSSAFEGNETTDTENSSMFSMFGF